MDDWWALVGRDAEILEEAEVSGNLKTFGYAVIFDFIRKRRPKRILELGHGIWNPLLFQYARRFDDVEIWGVDDYADLAYFPPKDEWETGYETNVLRAHPHVKAVRGLIGRADTDAKLPKDYFDLICSVSVLEELPLDDVTNIATSCRQLLRPGGHFLNSYDIRVRRLRRVKGLRRLTGAFEAAGFKFDPPMTWFRSMALIKGARSDKLLLEDPTYVMTRYQGTEGDDRRYWGHFGTVMIDVAR